MLSFNKILLQFPFRLLRFHFRLLVTPPDSESLYQGSWSSIWNFWTSTQATGTLSDSWVSLQALDISTRFKRYPPISCSHSPDLWVLSRSLRPKLRALESFSKLLKSFSRLQEFAWDFGVLLRLFGSFWIFLGSLSKVFVPDYTRLSGLFGFWLFGVLFRHLNFSQDSCSHFLGSLDLSSSLESWLRLSNLS